MSDEIARWSLVETAAQIRAREVSAEEVVAAALGRIEALQPALNCFISIDGDEALETAREIDARIARGEDVGPLAGVPLAHKDMYYRRGKVSTCGSKIRRDVVADRTATVLDRLDGAGAIYLGGLNMSEFAVGPIGHNVHFGHCHNPWNTDHAPGGSSSGAGASVSARLVCGALGSDTGGSIRMPSSFSGVVGCKPTQTRVSRYGVMPLSFSFDCVGPMTRTVADNARMLAVIAGADPLDTTASQTPVADYEAACGRPITGLRIGLPVNYYNEGLDGDIEAAMAAAIDVFKAQGAEPVEVSVPDPAEMNQLWTIALSAEAATLHRRWLRERPQDYGEQIRRRIEVGLYHPATHYLEALSLREAIARDFIEQVFEVCDVLLTPTTPIPAPTLEETDIGAAADMPEMILHISKMTRPTSFLGLPALSVPCGFSGAGLPLGLQLIGRPFDEATLYGVGAAYQNETDWHRRVPPVATGESP